jgi:16S rRNA (adenine1518-N6/adenine1519-N6)-dimethyltransferase
MTAVEGRPRQKKRFGQHFLTSAETADRIAGFGELVPGDFVLEIGPGRGILTERLLARTPHVTAVEIDRDLLGDLRERFRDHGDFRLVEGDILKVDLGELFRDAPGRIKVVSNIPYNISAPIIELLIRNRGLVSSAVLMMQKEVALRLVAAPGTKDYGLTTMNLRLCATAGRVMDVKPGSFSPPPEVMSSVVRIELNPGYRYPLRDERIFREVTGAAFRQRRKMVRNTLIPYLAAHGVPLEHAVPFLEGAGIDPTCRPEDIDVGEWVRLANAIPEKG